MEIYRQVINEVIKLKKVSDSNGYIEFAIYEDGIEIGYLNIDLDRGNLKMDSIYLKPEYQGSGKGKLVIQTAIKILKKKYSFNQIVGFAVSRQSGNMIIKALGQPIRINTMFGEYDDFNIAADKLGLPNTATVDDDGTIMHGESDAVMLVFKA